MNDLSAGFVIALALGITLAVMLFYTLGVHLRRLERKIEKRKHELETLNEEGDHADNRAD